MSTKYKILILVICVAAAAWLLGLLALKVYAPEAPDESQSETAFEEQKNDTGRENMVINFYDGEPKNPLFNTSVTNRQVLRLVYDPIIGQDSTLKPVPGIAQSFKKKTDRIILAIRTDISFSDGTVLKASHVRDVLEFIRQNPDLPYYSAGQKILRVNLLSEDSLEILFAPEAPLQLCDLDIPVVKDPKEEKSRIGTGRYRFSKDGKHLLAVKDQLPIGTIDLLSLPGEDAVDFAFKSGDSDVLDVGTATDSRLTYYGDFKEYGYTSLDFTYLCVNGQGLFADAKIRSYVSGLLNRDKISEMRRVNADMPFFPDWWAVERPEEKGFALLSETGLADVDGDGMLEQENGADLPPVVILTNGDSEEKTQIAQRIADQLAIAGFSAKVKAISFTDYTNALQTGKFTLALVETVLDKGNSLIPLISQNGALNFGGFYHPKVEEGLTALKESTSLEDYRQTARNLYEVVAQQTPVIPLFFKKGTIIVSSQISGDVKPIADYVFSGFENWQWAK